MQTETIAALIKDHYGMLPKGSSKELINAEVDYPFAVHETIYGHDPGLIPKYRYSVTFIPLGVTAFKHDSFYKCKRFIRSVRHLSWDRLNDKKYICEKPKPEDGFEIDEYLEIKRKFEIL